MNHLTTDYLIIGSGAQGLAFADTLLDQTDAHITIIDRHSKPGGHWNDAYSFVALHQPSAFYGVNSMELGARRKDTIGVNKGLFELASGPEVSGYFDRVMNLKLLPSGRVSYFPMSNYLGDGQFESVLSGEKTQVTIRKKLVDAYYASPNVPATHTPKFTVSAGVQMVAPGALVHLWQSNSPKPNKFMIIGAGKTAMDVGVWLLNSGSYANDIQWVMPRDSWLINRANIQPGMEFFEAAIGGQAAQMEALASAESVDDLFAKLEAADLHLRIDPEQTPSMFHLASISKGEVEILRRIKNVIRMGRVQSIEKDKLVLDQGTVPLDAGTLCIDCTASAVEPRPTQPIFQDNKIVLQIVRLPQPSFSAALIAYVEANYATDAQRNQLCTPVPFPDKPAAYPRSMMIGMMNQFFWGQDKELRQWIRNSRLDGFGKMMAEAEPDNAAQQAILERLKAGAKAAMGNLPRLAVLER
jgi:NAD(P)-binding Rossmann-like domain